VVLLLDVKHRVIAEEVVSIGILDGALIHPREVFKAAITANAAAIIVAHNHPSGDLKPSGQDAEVTRRLRKAGEILGIPVVDHVIVGPTGGHFSFREGGDWS
jgi:DNA repair protein RadC